MSSVELVCFHHAGGGAASFHPLRRALATAGVDAHVTAVTLPGRESRRTETRHRDGMACVRAMFDELDDVLSRPHVLLGHSMGALLAYFLAQQRIARALRAPEAVVVASCRPPHQPPPLIDVLALGDHELAVELARYGGMPKEVLSHPEWLALLMPTIRDDLSICQTDWPSWEPPLPCPLYVIGGGEDAMVPRESLAEWVGYSALSQPVRQITGDHFLFRSPTRELVAEIARVLDETRDRKVTS
ncbi:MAG: alpha/beta fold hydrolase [Mycobacterium sp.]